MDSYDARQDLRNFEAQLAEVNGQLAADPDNAELKEYKLSVEEGINLCHSLIADVEAAAPPPEPAPEPEAKWSVENHPAFKASARTPAAPVEEAAAPSFKVNDTVLAQWVSGDRAFHPATIISVTGSSTNSVYNVRFNGYNDTETLRIRNLKAMDSRKRKAEDSPVKPAAPVATPQGSVISADANINQDLATAAKKQPSKVSDGPPRMARVERKVKKTKEIESGKSKWQEFASKNKNIKGMKKESMFRVPEGVNAKVGFVGSGQGMRKDPKRQKMAEKGYHHGADNEEE